MPVDAALLFSIGFHCGLCKCLIDKNLQRGPWMPPLRVGAERFQKFRQKLSRKVSSAWVANRSASRTVLQGKVAFFIPAV